MDELLIDSIFFYRSRRSCILILPLRGTRLSIGQVIQRLGAVFASMIELEPYSITKGV